MQAKSNGNVKGIKVSAHHYITHLLFIDDVLLFGIGHIDEWMYYKSIIDLFCLATGMSIGYPKSGFYSINCLVDFHEQIRDLLPLEIRELKMGFFYLGYFLKPCDYRIVDWHWLIQKFECRLASWTFRKLSLGGRLILLNSVLLNLPVFWLTLANVPSTILHTLRKISFNLMWNACPEKYRFHLVAWERIPSPMEKGGWGIRNLLWVSDALHLKSLWRGLFDSGLWGYGDQRQVSPQYCCQPLDQRVH